MTIVGMVEECLGPSSLADSSMVGINLKRPQPPITEAGEPSAAGSFTNGLGPLAIV